MSPSQAIERLRQVIRRQHKALSTEATYAHWLRRYIHALKEMPEDLPSEKTMGYLHAKALGVTSPLDTLLPVPRLAGR